MTQPPLPIPEPTPDPAPRHGLPHIPNVPQPVPEPDDGMPVLRSMR